VVGGDQDALGGHGHRVGGHQGGWPRAGPTLVRVSIGGGLVTLGRPRQPKVPMSLIVATANPRGVAVATDSVHVDLSTGQVRTGHVKHVVVGCRVGAIAGVSTVDDVDVLAMVAAALGSAATIQEVVDHVVGVDPPALLRAFARWRAVVGRDEDAENFLTVLAATAETGRGEVCAVYATEVSGTLTLYSRVIGSIGADSAVACAGAADMLTLAVTNDGRGYRRQQLLSRQNPTVPDVPQLPSSAPPSEASRWAAGVVEAAVGRQALLRRPGWWPEGAPVLAAPVNTDFR
jgi:hypothetical protein